MLLVIINSSIYKKVKDQSIDAYLMKYVTKNTIEKALNSLVFF